MNDSLSIIKSTTLLGKELVVYGDIENPLFMAKDVAEWIEYSKRSDGSYQVGQMLSSVDEDEKLPLTTLTGGQNRQVWMLTENGLYEVLMQSRKPIAKDFKRGVKEILKSVRKTGAYKNENAIVQYMSSPAGLRQILNNWEQDRLKLEASKRKVEKQEKIIQHKSEVIEGLVEDIPLAELRQRINQIVRYGRSKGFQERFRLLYKEFGLKYHMDLDRRFNSRKAEELKIKSKMDYVDRVLHMIPELYDLACKLFETDVNELIEKEWKIKIN